MGLSRSKVRISVAVLLLIPLLMYWIISPETSKDQIEDNAIRMGADYYLKGSQAKEFDANGKLTSILIVERLTHYPEHKSAQLDKPFIQVVDENNTPATLSSKTGTLFDNQTRLTLDEDVRLTHNPNTANASQLTTSSLTFDRSSGIAQSLSPVKIESKNLVTTATGFTININSRTSELLSDVKGTFYVDQ